MGRDVLLGVLNELDLVLVEVGHCCHVAQLAIQRGVNVDDEVVSLYESADLLGRLAERTTDRLVADRVARVGEQVRAIAAIIEMEAAL